MRSYYKVSNGGFHIYVRLAHLNWQLFMLLIGYLILGPIFCTIWKETIKRLVQKHVVGFRYVSSLTEKEGYGMMFFQQTNEWNANCST